MLLSRKKKQTTMYNMVGLENIGLKDTCTAGLNLYKVLEQTNYVLLEKIQNTVCQGEVEAV